MRIGHHQRIEPVQRGGDAGELACRFFAGKAQRMQAHRAQRRRGPVGPDSIDGVVCDRDQFRAGGLGRLFQPLRLSGRVQPRIVSHALPGFQHLLQPRFRRRVGQRLRLDQRRVCFFAHLQRVAAIHENCSPVRQDYRRSGRTRKARQPSQPRGAGRHIFVLVLVGARHDEAIELAALEFGAQQREAGGAERGIAFCIEGLEQAGKDHRTLYRIALPTARDDPPRASSRLAQPSTSICRTRKNPCPL